MLEESPATGKESKGRKPDIFMWIIQIQDREWTTVNSVRES